MSQEQTKRNRYQFPSGDKNPNKSLEAKKRQSDYKKQWWKTKAGIEAKKKLIDYNKSDLKRKQVSELHKNRVRTDKEKKNVGKATSKRFKDPIFRAKHKKAVNEANTVEKRKKISDSLMGHEQSEETKKKRSDTYLQKWQDPEFKIQRLKIWRSPNKDTKIERLVKEELVKRKIDFVQNKIFPEFHTIPDFYLPDRKIVVYCDGEYWHAPLERQIIDLTQVEVLRENSYIVFRLRGEDILKNVSECLDNIGLGEIKRLRIVVGLPTASDYFHRSFVQSLMSLKYPPHADVDINVVAGYQLPFARNRIVQHALETNADYVFFIDTDMIFPPDLLTRLLFHNVDICNALAFRRIEPHYPCIFKWNETEKCYETMVYYGGLQKADATGMACMLIKTDVFKVMKAPWYYYKSHLFSSDLTFCGDAKKAGFNVWVDTDLKVGHLSSEKIITEEYYLQHLSPEAKEQWNKGIRDFLKERVHGKELYKS